METALFEAAENSKKEAETEYLTNNKKAKANEIPSEIFDTIEVKQYEQYKNGNEFNATLLSDIIKYRLTWDDCSYGSIIYGVSNCYLDEIETLNALNIALSKGIIANLNIIGGKESYINHLNDLYKMKTEKIHKLKIDVE